MVLRVNLIALIVVLWMMTGCSLEREEEPLVVFVTATYAAITPPDTSIQNAPTTVAQVQDVSINNEPREYTVQPGDTLFAIASAHNTTIDTLIELNQLINPDIIEVGQVLRVPGLPENKTPSANIMADALFVRGPGSTAFNIVDFIEQQPGYIRNASDKVTNRLATGSSADEFLSAAEIVARVSIEFSVDPRLLLALLEYRAGWLSNPNPYENLKLHPIISEEDSEPVDRAGLYKQLAYTANELNRGYYGYKYEGWDALEFEDEQGTRLRFGDGINASTAGLQYMLHLNNNVDRWFYDVDMNGFYRIYSTYFGDPLAEAHIVTVPSGMTQPEMVFPFSSGEIWFYTGGPHGGWGSGSAWSAVDFAPPDDPSGVACYISEYPVTAVAAGVIARSEKGTVILDLDGDGDETTGWTVLYLHLADRIPAGTVVQTGNTVGYASCEGGFSTATHMHIGRRYNGEWIPATCQTCDVNFNVPTFNLSGWKIVGYRSQEYQGHMEKNGERRIAEQGRNTTENRVSR